MLALSFTSTAYAGKAPTKLTRSNVVAKAATEFAYGLPGAGNILGEFDPAGFLEGKDKLEVYRLREAELAHGRVSMLASLGFIVQEKFHPLFSGDGGPAIDQIPSLPIWLWGAMLAGIGSAEQYRIAKGWAKLNPETNKAASALREGYYPGDLSFDPLGLKPEQHGQSAVFGGAELTTPASKHGCLWLPPARHSLEEPRSHSACPGRPRGRRQAVPKSLISLRLTIRPEDPAEFRLMQEKELSHCRLAMIAAAGFLAQEAVTGQTWGTYWGDASL